MLTTHGKRRSSTLYATWAGIKQRCYNESHRQYRLYGARGIVMCDRWRDSFENFLADMGDKPAGTTIDRIDSDGNYEPSNCRWATPKQQANNLRTNVILTHRGMAKTITEWADHFGVSRNVIKIRLNRGHSAESVFSELEDRKGTGRKSSARVFSWSGMTKTVAGWAEYFGTTHSVIKTRLLRHSFDEIAESLTR